MKPLTPTEALRLVATLQFRPFTNTDWMGFAGCSSANPLLAETSDGFCVIIDEHPDDRRPCIYICNDEEQHHQSFYLGDSE